MYALYITYLFQIFIVFPRHRTSTSIRFYQTKSLRQLGSQKPTLEVHRFEALGRISFGFGKKVMVDLVDWG